MSHVVEVRAIERDGRSGTYIRAGFVWSPGWQEQVVSDEALAEISKDPWLELRLIDTRSQAAKRMQFAVVADDAAKAAESHAKDLRQKADTLLSEAQSAMDEVGHEPPPAPEPEQVPYQDALLAAMPDAVRPKSGKKR